jgi:hypothetical protein
MLPSAILHADTTRQDLRLSLIKFVSDERFPVDGTLIEALSRRVFIAGTMRMIF